MKANVAARGETFTGLIDYVFSSQKEPSIVGGNSFGTTPQQLKREFKAGALRRSDIRKPAWHASLSSPPGEPLSADVWDRITQAFMEKIGFSDAHQYVVVHHCDRDHDHVHIVANRVSRQREVWYGRFEAFRAIQASQELEREFGLTLTPGFDSAPDAAPGQAPRNTGVRTLTRQEIAFERRTRGQQPVRARLCGLIDEVLSGEGPIALEAFVGQLREQGVTAHLNISRSGRMNGMRFVLEGVAFKGSQLGRLYAWKSLRRRGVESVPGRVVQAHRLESSVVDVAFGQRVSSPLKRGLEAAIGRVGDWASFHGELMRFGLAYLRCGRGACIRLLGTDETCKASAFGKALSLSRLQARLGPFVPAAPNEDNNLPEVPRHRGWGFFGPLGDGACLGQPPRQQVLKRLHAGVTDHAYSVSALRFVHLEAAQPRILLNDGSQVVDEGDELKLSVLTETNAWHVARIAVAMALAKGCSDPHVGVPYVSWQAESYEAERRFFSAMAKEAAEVGCPVEGLPVEAQRLHDARMHGPKPQGVAPKTNARVEVADHLAAASLDDQTAEPMAEVVDRAAAAPTEASTGGVEGGGETAAAATPARPSPPKPERTGPSKPSNRPRRVGGLPPQQRTATELLDAKQKTRSRNIQFAKVMGEAAERSRSVSTLMPEGRETGMASSEHPSGSTGRMETVPSSAPVPKPAMQEVIHVKTAASASPDPTPAAPAQEPPRVDAIAPSAPAPEPVKQEQSRGHEAASSAEVSKPAVEKQSGGNAPAPSASAPKPVIRKAPCAEALRSDPASSNTEDGVQGAVDRTPPRAPEPNPVKEEPRRMDVVPPTVSVSKSEAGAQGSGDRTSPSAPVARPAVRQASPREDRVAPGMSSSQPEAGVQGREDRIIPSAPVPKRARQESPRAEVVSPSASLSEPEARDHVPMARTAPPQPAPKPEENAPPRVIAAPSSAQRPTPTDHARVGSEQISGSAAVVQPSMASAGEVDEAERAARYNACRASFGLPPKAFVNKARVAAMGAVPASEQSPPSMQRAPVSPQTPPTPKARRDTDAARARILAVFAQSQPSPAEAHSKHSKARWPDDLPRPEPGSIAEAHDSIRRLTLRGRREAGRPTDPLVIAVDVVVQLLVHWTDDAVRDVVLERSQDLMVQWDDPAAQIAHLIRKIHERNEAKQPRATPNPKPSGPVFGGPTM